MIRIYKKAGLTVITIVIAVLFLELIFRITYDPSQELDFKQSWRRLDAEKFVELNNAEIDGCSFREEPLQDRIFNPEYTRLLFLGDSFTIAAGVDRNQRFTDIVETLLNHDSQTRNSGAGIHVFNAGRGATEPSDWVEFARKIIPVYSPGHVFAIFFLRDGSNMPSSLKFNQDLIEPIRARYAAMPLNDNSCLLRYFYNRMAWKAFSKEYQIRLKNSYLGTEEQTRKWKKEQQSLLKISGICSRKNIPFHLIIFPILLNLKDYEFEDVEDAIKAFAQDHDIPCFSLLEGFRGRTAENLWIASNDQHPNEIGHRIAAETLLPYIRTMINRPPVPAPMPVSAADSGAGIHRKKIRVSRDDMLSESKNPPAGKPVETRSLLSGVTPGN